MMCTCNIQTAQFFYYMNSETWDCRVLPLEYRHAQQKNVEENHKGKICTIRTEQRNNAQ